MCSAAPRRSVYRLLDGGQVDAAAAVLSRPPERAGELLAALSRADRPLWATAIYAGLRRGELMALRWKPRAHVDSCRGHDGREAS